MGRSWFLAAALAPLAVGVALANDLTISPEQISRMEIDIKPATSTVEQIAAILPGTVVPALNARIVAAAPFSGTVTQVHVLPGERVLKGQKLATVSSRELLEADATLAQAEAELQAAEAIAKRRRDLATKNIQHPTMADEAEAHVAKITAVIDQHRRMLSIGGIRAADNGFYVIEAPEAGRVVEADILPGDKLDAMAPAVTLDTKDDLWVEAQVPARLVGQLTRGDKVIIEDGPQGEVVSVGHSLDKMTRSATLIARIPAGSGLLPGQMVTLTVVQDALTGAMSVPSTAVARVNGAEGLFVHNDSGFTLVPVRVAGRSPTKATVFGNLEQGAKVAASGLPQLEQLLETD